MAFRSERISRCECRFVAPAISVAARCPDETGSVALSIRGYFAFHGRDLRIVETVRAFAACDDDSAFVEFEPNETRDVVLCFCDERLKRFTLRENQKPL